jgi:hypothetical protein
VRPVRRSVLRLGPEALQGPLAVWPPEPPVFPASSVSSVSSWHRRAAFPERQLPVRQFPEAARALVRAVDRQVPHLARAQRLASQRELPVSRTALPASALPVLFWRRSAALLCQAHLQAARARVRAADQPAPHSASPAALARAPRRAVSAAWGVLVLRPVVQHGAAAPRAASGAAAALLPEAEALRA